MLQQDWETVISQIGKLPRVKRQFMSFVHVVKKKIVPPTVSAGGHAEFSDELHAMVWRANEYVQNPTRDAYIRLLQVRLENHFSWQMVPDEFAFRVLPYRNHMKWVMLVVELIRCANNGNIHYERASSFQIANMDTHYSDTFTIQGKDESYTCTQFVLYARAPSFYFFMKERADSTGTVYVENFRPYRLLIEFCLFPPIEMEIDADTAADCYSLADKFDLPDFATAVRFVVGESAVPPPNTVSEDLEHLFLSGELADVRIRSSDGIAYNAHRDLLVARSDYFAGLFRSGMIEAKQEEIPFEATGKALYALLFFLYTDRLQCEEKYLLELLGLSHKYDDPVMKYLYAIINERLREVITSDNIDDVEAVAKLINANDLLDYIQMKKRFTL